MGPMHMERFMFQIIILHFCSTSFSFFFFFYFHGHWASSVSNIRVRNESLSYHVRVAESTWQWRLDVQSRLHDCQWRPLPFLNSMRELMRWTGWRGNTQIVSLPCLTLQLKPTGSFLSPWKSLLLTSSY